jgi:hypothetical protein
MIISFCGYVIGPLDDMNFFNLNSVFPKSPEGPLEFRDLALSPVWRRPHPWICAELYPPGLFHRASHPDIQKWSMLKLLANMVSQDLSRCFCQETRVQKSLQCPDVLLLYWHNLF